MWCLAGQLQKLLFIEGRLLISVQCLQRECAVYHLLNCVSTVAVAVATLDRYLDNTVVMSDFIHDQMVLRLDWEWQIRF